MKSENIKKVGIVGAGTMGHGIAQSFATGGYDVVLRDIDEAILSKARENNRKSLEKLGEKDKLGGRSPEDILEHIHYTTELDPLADTQLAVEAVVEKLDVKKNVFQELDQILSDGALLASNTSSISITDLASETSRPESFIGMHFFNPVPMMALVEVVRGMETSDQTVQSIVELAEDLGKTPVQVNDYPGFVSNRILAPMLNEAFFTLMEGVAGIEEIDEIMKLGMGHPMGPLELADMIGLDVCLEILEVLHRDLGEDKYRPCPLLRKKVEAGHLGKKTGKGFYEYE